MSTQNDGTLMNASPSDTYIEPRWRTYLRGAAFSIPALFILAFSSVFLLPKLETLWRDAAFGASSEMAPSAIAAVRLAYFVTQHLVVIAVIVITVLVLLEWRSRRWPRYRRATIGIAAFLANTAILIFITAMFMTALMTAPALLRMK
jgi:hypothetical protein